MKELLANFYKPGAPVMHYLSGTLATTKGSLSLNKHRRFIGCDINGNCLAADLPGLLLVFGIQVLDNDSDISFDYNVQDSARVYVTAMETA